MNSLCVKAKFQMGNLKFEQIFSKFVAQFDLEGQGHKFLK